MADNVNIIVQDTINDIVVNAAVVVETIDINVQAAVDVVDIVANPNNYVVNINRIIGEQVQSDWTQTDNQAPDYIKNKPTIPAAQVNSDWDATSGVAKILNKPTIPTNTSDLINDGENGVDPFITAADIPPVTGFVPYTGATANVDLGEYELKAGQLTLDTTPTGTAAVATTRWNDSIGSSETTLKGGTVVLKNGVDLVARIVNKVTPNATLLRANYTAVRISGAQGQRLAVAYAQANNDNNSADTIGLVCENIATNQEGFIMTMGQFEEINTTGSLQGETWVDGDVLYLSPTTAGRLTNIKPTGATGHIVVMGYVEYAHANHGKIYVKIMNGWELDELHNCYINSPVNNDGLFYDSADAVWKNKTIATALGFTPENVANKSTSTSLGTSNTLYPTQNAVKVYADTKFTLPSLTSGSVLFSNGTTIAQDNANFFWDDTNNRLGIGTNAPVSTLHIQGNYAGGDDNLIPQLRFQNANTTSSVNLYALAKVLVGNGFAGGYPELWLQARRHSDNTGSCSLRVVSNHPLIFETNNTDRGRFFANGNFGIGTGSTDAGFKLDVNGTARVQGNATIVAATPVLNINVTANTQTSALYFNALDGTPRAGIMANIATGEIRYLATATGYFPTFYSNNLERMRIATTGNVLINTTTDVASSKLTIASTTQGFLPPRMTTTQKNAIATPAAGLVVYDTTLNKLCLYTTTWETITSI